MGEATEERDRRGVRTAGVVSSSDGVEAAVTEPTLHSRKRILFALSSAADLALTWWLLDRPDAPAYEANPVASWCLARFGWLGLACFKLAMVGLVLGLVAVICRSRPRAAGRVLQLGCACQALVVAYSAALGGTSWTAGGEDVARFNAELDETTNRETHLRNRKKGPFRALLARSREDVLAGRCTLAEAAERLQGPAHGLPAEHLRCLAHCYPDRPVCERVGCFLLVHVVSSVDAPAEAMRVFLRLEGEFQSGYGSRLPREARLRLGFHPPGREEPAAPTASRARADLARLPTTDRSRAATTSHQNMKTE